MAATQFKLELSGVEIERLDEVNIKADGAESKTIDFQMQDGEDDDNGNSETVLIKVRGALLKLDKETFVVDGTGKGSFIVGPLATAAGCGRIEVLVEIAGFFNLTFLMNVTM